MKDISQCSRDFKFDEISPWPKLLPAFAWRGHLLCAFDRSQGPVVEMDEFESHFFISCFKTLHSHLSLSEWAEIVTNWKPEALGLNWSELFSAYNLRWSEDLKLSLECLSSTPLIFRQWTVAKEIMPRDLAPLRPWAPSTLRDEFLNFLATLNPSKSNGTQALDWASDLSLSGFDFTPLSTKCKTADELLSQLKAARYPNSSASDQSQQDKVKKLPWPSHTQGLWARQGDEAYLEVKLKARSAEELKKRLSALMQFENNLHSSVDSPWKN